MPGKGQRHFRPVKGQLITTDAPPPPGATAAAAAGPRPANPAVLKNYLAALKRLVAVIRRSGAEPVFAIQVDKDGDLATYSQLGGKMACDLGVRVLDARRAFAAYPGPRDELFHSKVHVTARGAAVFADYLYDRLYAHRGFTLCPGN